MILLIPHSDVLFLDASLNPNNHVDPLNKILYLDDLTSEFWNGSCLFTYYIYFFYFIF